MDSFTADPEEHRRSATKSAKSKITPTCDGQPCKVRDLRCDIRCDVALIAGEVDAATLYRNHSDLSKTMHRYAERICAHCHTQVGEVERPERDEKCQAVMKASIGRTFTAHHRTPIDNLPAYLNGELKRLTHVGDLCGDDLVSELRSRRRNGTSEAGRVGDFLPMCEPARSLSRLRRAATSESEPSMSLALVSPSTKCPSAARTARGVTPGGKSNGVDADHVLIWQVTGKLKRRHGLVLGGEPRQPGCRVVDWTWEAPRVRSSLASH